MAQKLEDMIMLALRRNKRLGIKPGSQTDIAYYFGLLRPYVHQLINGKVANTEATRKRVREIYDYVGVFKE